MTEQTDALGNSTGMEYDEYGRMMRNPQRGCGSVSPFAAGFGYSAAKGYRYDVPKAGGVSRKQKRKFSLKETAVGGITGGVASAGFYGAGKGIERLKDGFRAKRSVTGFKRIIETRGEEYPLYSRKANAGKFSKQKEPITIEHW